MNIKIILTAAIEWLFWPATIMLIVGMFGVISIPQKKKILHEIQHARLRSWTSQTICLCSSALLVVISVVYWILFFVAVGIHIASGFIWWIV
jgi:hypothetical protein